MIEERMEMAMTKELYCFAVRVSDRFACTLFAPLFPSLVANTRLESTISDQTWISDVCDRPLFLIPYNDPIAERHALAKQQFNLWPTKTPPEDAIKTITFPTEFSLSLEPHFHFKVENNQLYKHEGGQWELVPSGQVTP